MVDSSGLNPHLVVFKTFPETTYTYTDRYDPRLLLHRQQYIEIYKPLPSSATLCDRVLDFCKAAVIEIETKSHDKESGQLLCMNRLSVFLRGADGFLDPCHPFSYSKYPTNQVTSVKVPKNQSFAVFEEPAGPSQLFSVHTIIDCLALLHRLSGDYNPLHSDPFFAKAAGFSRPILHGLCTLGFAVRAIIKSICRGDANMVKAISGRFLLHVYPGEVLITEMWLEGLRVIYQTKVKERNHTVLSGYVDLHR